MESPVKPIPAKSCFEDETGKISHNLKGTVTKLK
jgi:hypothetical protein